MTVALCVCRSLSLCWAFCSFFWGGDVALVHTYLHIRILGAELRYVRMWYIIRQTKTKRSRTRVHACTRHACTRADFFFGMYQLETRFARIKKRFWGQSLRYDPVATGEDSNVNTLLPVHDSTQRSHDRVKVHPGVSRASSLFPPMAITSHMQAS